MRRVVILFFIISALLVLVEVSEQVYNLYLPLIGRVVDLPSSTPTGTPTKTLTPVPTTTSITPSPSGGVINFVDGYGGDVDTGKDLLMSSGWPTRNGGQHANFQLDGPPAVLQHAMLQFNLSSIPSNATCISATLYLYHSYPPENGSTVVGNIYSVSQSNSDWIEGTGNIDPALRGEPCWNAKESDGAGGVLTPWAGSAGCSTSGIDYEAAAIGSYSFEAASKIGTEVVIPLDTDRVAGWFGSSNTNYGIILITSEGSAHAGSAENPTPGFRPKLIVEYLVPNE